MRELTEWVIRKDTELSTLGHSPVRGDAASLQKQLVSDVVSIRILLHPPKDNINRQRKTFYKEFGLQLMINEKYLEICSKNNLKKLLGRHDLIRNSVAVKIKILVLLKSMNMVTRFF